MQQEGIQTMSIIKETGLRFANRVRKAAGMQPTHTLTETALATIAQGPWPPGTHITYLDQARSGVVVEMPNMEPFAIMMTPVEQTAEKFLVMWAKGEQT